MVPPVARITTLGFLPAAFWAQVVVTAITAATTTTIATLMNFMTLSSRDLGPERTGPWPSSGPLSLVLALVQVGQLDRVEQIFDLILGQDVLLADDLEDPLTALVGLGRQLG